MVDPEIIVVDDFIGKAYQSYVQEQFSDKSISWQFLEDVAYTKGDGLDVCYPGFRHPVYRAEEGALSSAFWVIYPVLLEAAEKAGVIINELLRIQLGINVQRHESVPNNIHIDTRRPHLVGLYYPKDSDGDTFFFNDMQGSEVIFRSTPKAGRMVFFDGSIPHASSDPVETIARMSVNFNFTGSLPPKKEVVIDG